MGGPGFVFGMSFRFGYRYWARGCGPWPVRRAGQAYLNRHPWPPPPPVNKRTLLKTAAIMLNFKLWPPPDKRLAPPSRLLWRRLWQSGLQKSQAVPSLIKSVRVISNSLYFWLRASISLICLISSFYPPVISDGGAIYGKEPLRSCFVSEFSKWVLLLKSLICCLWDSISLSERHASL